MKYSMMTYSLVRQYKPNPVDMADVLDVTVQLGLDAVDQVGLYGYEPSDLRKMADDRGLRFICYTQKLSFSSPDASERAPRWRSFAMCSIAPVRSARCA